MVEKSTGITGGLHKQLQQIKKNNPEITISGFACYALDEVLSRKGSVNNIIDRIHPDSHQNLGA